MRRTIRDFIALFLFGIICSCTYGQVGDNNEASNTQPSQTTAQGAVYPTDENTYIRTDGWPVSDFIPPSSDSLRSPAKRVPGSSEGLNETVYEFRSIVETEEPYKTLGLNAGKVRILSIREYDMGGRRFCYEFTVSPVAINVETGAHSIVGMKVFYRYYDEDGDGKFETLKLRESNISPLDMPEWVRR
jgi:hypothetical protein